MYLHLIIDSPAFTQSIIDRVHQYSNDVAIVVISSWRQMQLLYQGKSTSVNVFQAMSWVNQQSIQVCTAHFLTPLAAFLMSLLSPKTKLQWVVWGGDYYNLPQVSHHYYDTSNYPRKSKIKSKIGYRFVNNLLPCLDRVVANACDSQEIQRHLDLKAEYTQLNHLLDITQFDTLDSATTQHMVLLGNSDDATNHHLTTVNVLAGKLPQTTKLVVPLSGVVNGYTSKVKNTVLQYFPESIVLDRFLPSDQYFELLGQCQHLVYGHWRQQGMATLFPFLLSGRLCYFHPNNPYEHYLHTLGIKTFDYSRININQTLTQSEIDTNRRVIKQMLDTDTINQQWQAALT